MNRQQRISSRPARRVVLLVATCLLSAGAQAEVAGVVRFGDHDVQNGTFAATEFTPDVGKSVSGGSIGMSMADSLVSGSLAQDHGAIFSPSTGAGLLVSGPGGGPIDSEPTGGGGVSPIPELDTWIMTILGFGMAGSALRHRARRLIPA